MGVVNKKNLITNVASLGIVQVTNYVLPLISIPIISRIIGPEKFGVINYAVAFIAYFNILITYGFDLTATRKIAIDPGNQEIRNKVFSEVFQTQFFLFLFSTILFTGCLYIFPPLESEKKVAIFSFLFCIGTLFTQNWLFVAMQDISKIAMFDLVSKLLFTATILLVVQKKEDYIWQPLVTSMTQIIVAIISFTWAIKKYNLKFTKSSTKKILLLLKYEGTIFFSLLLINLYTTTNIIILGLLQDSEKVGFYTGGQKLIIVVSSVVSLPLSHALFPYIGKAFAENHQKGILIVQKVVPLVILLTGSMGIAILLIGPWALRLFYGQQFESSVLVFQLLAFTPMFIAMSSIFGIQIMLNLKMDRLFFKITLIAAILSILTNFLLIGKYGYLGAASTWLFTEVFIAVTMYLFLRLKGINPIDIKQFHPKAVKSQFDPLLHKFTYANS